MSVLVYINVKLVNIYCAAMYVKIIKLQLVTIATR